MLNEAAKKLGRGGSLELTLLSYAVEELTARATRFHLHGEFDPDFFSLREGVCNNLHQLVDCRLREIYGYDDQADRIIDQTLEITDDMIFAINTMWLADSMDEGAFAALSRTQQVLQSTYPIGGYDEYMSIRRDAYGVTFGVEFDPTIHAHFWKGDGYTDRMDLLEYQAQVIREKLEALMPVKSPPGYN